MGIGKITLHSVAELRGGRGGIQLILLGFQE
jgi:hypothetical protein